MFKNDWLSRALRHINAKDVERMSVDKSVSEQIIKIMSWSFDYQQQV